MAKIKAVALFSGGLDSILAIKLIQEQGIEVIAVAFTSPFFILDDKKEKLKGIARENRFKLIFEDLGDEYLDIVRSPKHGHGKNMNPCIDCHAYMMRKAEKIAEKEGAKFIFTGEVLGERPMSQNLDSLKKVEKEAGFKDQVLRPLSAKLLEETEAERKGYVEREKLEDIKGRGRRRQLDMVKRFNIKDFESPGGGCLLTYRGYSKKLRDLLKNGADIEDVRLLKAGRYFRTGKSIIITGRNKEDNENLFRLSKKDDYLFKARNIKGPVTLLRGPKTEKAIKDAAGITASYSGDNEISYGGFFKKKDNLEDMENGFLDSAENTITADKMSRKELEERML